MIIVSDDAILAAQIVPVKRPGGKISYTAMVSVSKGKDERGADQGESFDTPQEALVWLRQRLAVSLFDSIAPLK